MKYPVDILMKVLGGGGAMQTFDNAPHWVLLKEMLSHMFCTPKRHHKSKPFFDHVISFSVADGRIWLRNYQVPHPSFSPIVRTYLRTFRL